MLFPPRRSAAVKSRRRSARSRSALGATRAWLPPGFHLHAERTAVDRVRVRRRGDAAAERVRPARPRYERAERGSTEVLEGGRDLWGHRQLHQRATGLVSLYRVVPACLGRERKEPSELAHRSDTHGPPPD